MSKGKYKAAWEQDPRFKEWIKRVGSNPNKLFCKCCEKEQSLSNMYEARVIEHSQCSAHLTSLETWRKHRVDASQFFGRPKVAAANPKPNENQMDVVVSESEDQDTTEGEDNAMLAILSNRMRCTIAEIKWILNGILKGYSYRDYDRDNGLLNKLFSADPISNMFSCGRTKAMYTCVFRIDPYIQEQIISLLGQSDFFAISVDGTYNQTTRSEQVDYQLRLYNKKTGRVEDHYFKSDWIGHKRATDLYDSFIKSTTALDTKKCVHVGRDNVKSNTNFMVMYAEHRKDKDQPTLADISMCILHSANRAIINANKTADLGVSSFLEGAHHTFNKSSSRIEDLLSVSETKLLPLGFCETRFLENVKPAERALVIFKDLQRYVEKFQPPKSEPKKLEKMG